MDTNDKLELALLRLETIESRLINVETLIEELRETQKKEDAQIIRAMKDHLGDLRRALDSITKLATRDEE